MAIRYSNTPQLVYGNAPRLGEQPTITPNSNNSRPQLPANARPMSTAPIGSIEPIWVYDRTGRGFRSIYYKDAWQKLSAMRDPFNGTVRWQMAGKGAVDHPVGSSSS